ncbi:hypothetical protein [Haladaptatus sp.]|uniref:hypothetical protein n=1 Tax=Haladaptatus sp. TaxID=1973141 RepID=UPI003C48A596
MEVYTESFTLEAPSPPKFCRNGNVGGAPEKPTTLTRINYVDIRCLIHRSRMKTRERRNPVWAPETTRSAGVSENRRPTSSHVTIPKTIIPGMNIDGVSGRIAFMNVTLSSTA